MTHPQVSATKKPSPFSSLLPRRQDLAAMARFPRADLTAGVTVAIVALPLALAFGAASGLGAQAGVTTAIVAGIVAALFGGSSVQVSGPTGAMTVVLVPIVQQFGASAALQVGFLAGLLLVAMALARIGGLVRYLPVSVIEGFTVGIAVVIALQQVPVALGIDEVAPGPVWRQAIDAGRAFLLDPNLIPVLVAVGVAAVILVGGRLAPRVPFSIIAIAAVTGIAQVAGLDVARIGALPSGLPAPSLSFFELDRIGVLLGAAMAVAALAALESLLCAAVADGMTGRERHDPDRELFGQGLANLVAPAFGGVPATAAIARTAVNVRAGGVSRLSSVSHAVILLLVIAVAAPLASEIPLAALAGVLFATTIRMVDGRSVRALMRSTRADAIVVALTFAVTVLVDLVTAVGVGLALAVILALRDVARNARTEQVPLDATGHGTGEHELLSEHIVAYRLDGPLVFAAAHKLLELPDHPDVRVVILRMSRVSSLDATGARHLAEVLATFERRRITVVLSGLRPEHRDILAALGVIDRLEESGRIFPDTKSAVAASRQIVADSVEDRVPQPTRPAGSVASSRS